MTRRLPLAGAALLAGAIALTAPIDRAQSQRSETGAPPAQRPWSWPDRAKNLDVLDDDTTPDQLRAIMTGFTRALGVRCSYCHVGREGQPLGTYDFPSDRNPKKDVARGMLKMLGKVNKELRSIQPDKKDRANMWCHTCHHGRPVPMTLAEELTRVYTAAGTDSAIAHYRMLRSRFLVAGAYDFRETSLDELGELALARKDASGAVAFHRLNVEHFPESGRVHASLGAAYLAAGDTARAVASLEKAVQVEPRNARAKEMLESLRK